MRRCGRGNGEKGDGRPDAGGAGVGIKEKGAGFPRFHSTGEMIRAIEEGEFPPRAMITFHPQRWTDNAALWARELVWQGVKNGVKRRLVKRRKRKDKSRKS